MSRIARNAAPNTSKRPKTFFGWLNKYKIVLVLVVIVILFDIFVTGYLKFAYNTVRCGQMPVISSPNLTLGGYNGYIVPGDNGYKSMAGNKYYCTQQEAESKGIKVDPLTNEAIRQDSKSKK